MPPSTWVSTCRADLAVVSFDGIEYAAYTRPGLTTVSQPITQMAEVATQLLIDALGGGTIPPGTRVLADRAGSPRFVRVLGRLRRSNRPRVSPARRRW